MSSGEEHTYEGSVVDHYDTLASPQPGEHGHPPHLTRNDQQIMTVSKSLPQPADVSCHKLATTPTSQTMLLLAYVYTVTGYQEFDWLANVASDVVAQKKILPFLAK